MKLQYKKTLFAAILLFLSNATFVNATIITHGNLITDTTGTTITDIVTGREYLRFDQIDLTYADTFTAVLPGGGFYGWSIADGTIALDFIRAALANSLLPSTCTDPTRSSGCGQFYGVPQWNDGDFGVSWSNSSDAAWIINKLTWQNNFTPRIGAVEFFRPFVQYREPFQDINAYDGNTQAIGLSLNALLYRDKRTTVSEPASLTLLGLGLIGIGFRRLRILYVNCHAKVPHLGGNLHLKLPHLIC